MAVIQLDLFESDDTSMMKKDINDMETTLTKMRKKLFCENGKLSKQVLDLTHRLEIIEQGLCRET